MSLPAAATHFTVRTADGLTLAASRHGAAEGPGIILIHGLGQSRLSWMRQTAGTLAETCRIVSYDLRGHGDSSKPADVAAYADPALWADDLHAVIEASGFARPILVGWSLGGLIAGFYLRKYGQDRVGGVNLVGAVTKLAPDLLGQAALAHVDLLGSADLGVRSAAYATFLAACFATPPDDADFRRMLVFNGMVPREVQLAVPKLDSEGLDEVWAAIPKLLVTWGDQERHTRLEMSQRVLDLNPAARLSIFEGAAHAPFYERPERFNRELAAFARG
ncbi:alpha/beta fold hydrolase [Azospirillum picis]|uniref:Pimeloyl-ACP methyl ester carboxylesterase n=1 Tax=Azospirillum picis TaxID=488438 RepID=A0ABU0MNS7_9PROT|nr:alpha/beta hydrolase [Azospirillum picis]MBP2301179.1 pimeloyl-ACP methyl ester carboxylesterase [Azospirillum picis]MDQ0534858.1 pimeloyl-ACP methyl ester carboxylesterase [Azospirillum picis]